MVPLTQEAEAQKSFEPTKFEINLDNMDPSQKKKGILGGGGACL